ncbi:MAG: heme exporter protein CcmB [Deltaproteobacteria bacterium]|nr:heme exporter protein CcmB [Deltaproteobacteria bacterium]
MNFLRCFFAVFYKDLLSELRQKEILNTLLFFGVLIVFLFSFALGTDPGLLKKISPGLLWLVILFSSVLALDRSFQAELEEGCLDHLVLYASSQRALFLGKTATNFCAILIVQVVTAFAMMILFDLPAPDDFPLLAAAFLLGDLGIAVLGTFYAALTIKTRARQAMLPLLLFPMLIPLLLSAVYATQTAMEGSLTNSGGSWLSLLAIYDLIFLTACTLAIEPLLET